ncbi:MAG: RimK family alpha-L-glutamate ligase [Alphaproteobacteria bacterium]
MGKPKIYVIHEHDAWVEPLRAAFAERGLPYAEWFLDEGSLDLTRPPPEGVFYNRMSASSHTRGHVFAPEYAACVLAWLEGHGRRVVNSGRALRLEVSKVAQYAALEAQGIRTPRTVAAVGREAIVEAARGFDRPFITKHNRAGKGLGVHLFHDAGALESYVAGDEFEPSRDGVTLIQEYIAAPEPFITRVEFVGGRLLYAVRVDTSEGFELCPADACRIEDRNCPAGETPPGLFTVLTGFEHPLVGAYERFLAANGIEIAGVEFIVDGEGRAYTYDINTNTNYNPQAEATAGVPGRGMGAIADFLCRELARLTDLDLPCAAAAVAAE